MHVVLLAAGLGSRLGALTRELPKALVPVGGRPLLSHALRFAARLDPTRVVVVGGFGFSQVEEVLAGLRRGDGPESKLPIELVENPRFRDGNLVSLFAARSRVEDGFVLMNVDHVYRGAIADVVRPPVVEVTAFVDTDRRLGDDDMKVLRDDRGRVREIAKTLRTFDGGYVGMTRVPREALSRYWGTAERALADEGPTIHVERVLARLAEGDAPPVCRDVSGHGWLEVDTPDERAHADGVLHAGGFV